MSFISIFKYQFAEFQGNINSDIYYIKYTCKLIYFITPIHVLWSSNQVNFETEDKTGNKQRIAVTVKPDQDFVVWSRGHLHHRQGNMCTSLRWSSDVDSHTYLVYTNYTDTCISHFILTIYKNRPGWIRNTSIKTQMKQKSTR